MTYSLTVTKGPLAGQSFPISSNSIKLGRSSSCDIEIHDMLLSRSQCCFELRDGELWVIDLASANGTSVNGDSIEERKLVIGDRILVGDSELVVTEEGGEAAIGIDLGFEKEGAKEAPKRNFLRPLIWGIGAVLILVIGGALIFDTGTKKPQKKVIAKPLPPADLLIEYERVSADTGSVFRYEMTLTPKGLLAVKIDEVGAHQADNDDRHIQKEKQLDKSILQDLVQDVENSGFFSLQPSYSGFSAGPNAMESRSLTIALGKKVHTTKVLNRDDPDPFRSIRERLETFSKNELGIWAIQFSAEKLTALASESLTIGQKKFAEREVKYGNLFEALRSFHEAVFYLDTVNPKPDFYSQILEGAEKAETELDKRYKDQRFRADRAINLSDWTTAQRELRILCEMIPDRGDKRHREASQKLMDVENRLKKR